MTVQDQIVQLLKKHEQLTISQIAHFLQKDLPQISKNVKKLVDKEIVKKTEYSIPGDRSRKRMIQLVNPQLVKTTCQTQVVNTNTKERKKLEKELDDEIEQLVNPQLVNPQLVKTTCQTQVVNTDMIPEHIRITLKNVLEREWKRCTKWPTLRSQILALDSFFNLNIEKS